MYVVLAFFVIVILACIFVFYDPRDVEQASRSSDDISD